LASLASNAAPKSIHSLHVISGCDQEKELASLPSRDSSACIKSPACFALRLSCLYCLSCLLFLSPLSPSSPLSSCPLPLASSSFCFCCPILLP
jgi:hypothetical protein